MDKTSRPLLIIFYRNPIPGKVKTRLAATVGDQKALEIYRALSQHTRTITEKLPAARIVYYTEAIEQNDLWPDGVFTKALQQGAGLGQRMENAFKEGFESGYTSICIIGTDCWELTTETILQAFEALNSADAVIGPARDGGYYLLGMNKLLPDAFRNKRWSTDTVLQDTIRDFDSLQLGYVKLPERTDVDTEDDLPKELKT